MTQQNSQDDTKIHADSKNVIGVSTSCLLTDLWGGGGGGGEGGGGGGGGGE